MNKYIAQHPKRKMIEVYANSSYDAAKVAASSWGFRNTSGISVTLIEAGSTKIVQNTSCIG